MSEFETPVEQPEIPVEQPGSPEIVEKKENIFTGIIGAVIGAVIGGASIVLLNQLGYVASICGLILAVCTIKGYELLGGKRSATGIIISIALMLITPYIADRISWALAIVRDLGYDFATAFQNVHLVIEMAEMQADYFKDLGMVYLFTALGAFGTLRGLVSKK